MEIEIIELAVPLEHLRKLAECGFGNLVKAVVDVYQGIMAIGGELHAYDEAVLLERGSKQHHLWGINIGPSQGNRSRGVDDPGDA